MNRRQELETALNWYSQTESKIYSEARKSIKSGDKLIEPTESQIKDKEEELRALYYRDEPEESETSEDAEEKEARIINEMNQKLSAIHEKLK